MTYSLYNMGTVAASQRTYRRIYYVQTSSYRQTLRINRSPCTTCRRMASHPSHIGHRAASCGCVPCVSFAWGVLIRAQTQIFRGTARSIRTNPETGTRNYFYHNTPVVGVLADGTIRLLCAGYRTAATKLAMNQASNQDNLGFQVFQRKREWFVMWKGQELQFIDGMILS